MDPTGKSVHMHNIRHSGGRYIMIHCNSINFRVMKEATLNGYGVVWFDEGAIANILSFRRIREKYPVCYETKGN